MPDPWAINASAGAPAYAADELRRLFALPLQYNGRTLGGKAGVRPGGNALQTSIVSTTITVRAGVACVDPALTTAQGPYWVALPADETHTLTAAHATLPRKDITVLRVYDHDEDASGLRLARSEYIVGTANASPVEPAVPAGSFRLSTIDVPASGGGSPVVTLNYPFTVATGGLLPVRTQAERDALTAYDGAAIYRQDRNWVEVHDGTAWRVQGVAVCSSTADRDSAITHPYSGQLAQITNAGDPLYQYDGSVPAWTLIAIPHVYCHVYQANGATQNILNTTPTAITFTGEVVDTHGIHSTSSNTSRITPTIAGRYRARGMVSYAATAAGMFNAQIRKNGALVLGAAAYESKQAINQAFVANTCSADATISCNGTTDYIELWTNHNFGGTTATFSNTTDEHSFLIVEYMGPS